MKGGNTITANQVAYNAQQEVQRHNLAGEVETNRHNVVTEQEVIRHNYAQEELGNRQLAETTRHNYMTEYYQKYAADTQRDIAIISASAQRYAADKNYAASVYAADTQKKIANSNQVNSLRLQQMKSTTELTKQRQANASAAFTAGVSASASKYAAKLGFKGRVVGSGLGAIGSMSSSLVHSYPLYAGGKP